MPVAEGRTVATVMAAVAVAHAPGVVTVMAELPTAVAAADMSAGQG
jgi:hypothetical protein